MTTKEPEQYFTEEFIICAAVEYRGSIICGRRHGDCQRTLENLLGPANDLPDRKNQGFMTSHDRYVDRQTAFKIAKKQNQIWHKLFDGIDEGALNSEDLY